MAFIAYEAEHSSINFPFDLINSSTCINLVCEVGAAISIRCARLLLTQMSMAETRRKLISSSCKRTQKGSK